MTLQTGPRSRGEGPLGDTEDREAAAWPRRPHLSLRGAKAPSTYLYWIVSDVVDARNFVIRILTMLNRNTKLIWREGAERGKEGHEVT